MDEIKHTNIIYMPTISELGGIETYVYELVKKYKDYDIAVVSKNCDKKQADRIKKYCRLYIHTDQKINCKVAIINYDQSIIDYINEDAEIYQTIHADYSNEIYKNKPQDHPRIKAFITITKYLQEKMKDILKTDKIILSYNPLTIEKQDKPIIIVSATRLHKHKGVEKMQKLVDELDKKQINYIWYIFSNELDKIHSNNVICLKNRLDISKWLSIADYVCLLSDSEACSYTLNEALYRNIPIICTPLPYLEEIGVKDGLNAYILDFNCSNVEDIVNKINKIPKFEFEPLKDNYDKILKKSKSRYKDYINTKARCICIYEKGYYDLELEKNIKYNEELPLIHIDRAKHLEKKELVKILEIIKEK